MGALSPERQAESLAVRKVQRGGQLG